MVFVRFILLACVFGATTAWRNWSFKGQSLPNRLEVTKKVCHVKDLTTAEAMTSPVNVDDLQDAFTKSGLTELLQRLPKDLSVLPDLDRVEIEELYKATVCTMGVMDVIGQRIFAVADESICEPSWEGSGYEESSGHEQSTEEPAVESSGSIEVNGPRRPSKVAECAVESAAYIIDLLDDMPNQADEDVVADDFVRITLSLNRFVTAIRLLMKLLTEEARGLDRSFLGLDRITFARLRALLKGNKKKKPTLPRLSLVKYVQENCPNGADIEAELKDLDTFDPASRLAVVDDLKDTMSRVASILQEYLDDEVVPDFDALIDEVCDLVPLYALQNHAYAVGETPCGPPGDEPDTACLTEKRDHIKEEFSHMEEAVTLEDRSVKAYHIWRDLSAVERGIGFYYAAWQRTDEKPKYRKVLRLLAELLKTT